MPSSKTKTSVKKLSSKKLTKRFDTLLAKHCLDQSTPQENLELSRLQAERRRRLYKNNAGYRRALNAARRMANRNTALATTLLLMVNAPAMTAQGRVLNHEFIPKINTIYVVRDPRSGYGRWFESRAKANRYIRDPKQTDKVSLHALTTVPSRTADRAWLAFDVANGGGLTKHYVWMARSLDDIASRFYRHMTNTHEYADLSLPSVWYEIE